MPDVLKSRAWDGGGRDWERVALVRVLTSTILESRNIFYHQVSPSCWLTRDTATNLAMGSRESNITAWDNYHDVGISYLEWTPMSWSRILKDPFSTRC